MPSDVRKKAAAASQIGFGNVIKVLMLFATRWWAHGSDRHLSDLTFLLSDARIPVWWTQYPSERAVLTGWLGGPRTLAMAHLTEDQLIEMGLASLADIFVTSRDELKCTLVEARAMNWGNDRFARGAYSYATPETREAQSVLAGRDGGAVLFSGEAIYGGRDMGTVEAALASGLETARTILSA